jgi:hypothetical protein
MIEVFPPMGKYKYDTWRILPVKCYIDISLRLWSCIRNVNRHLPVTAESGSSMSFFRKNHCLCHPTIGANTKRWKHMSTTPPVKT